MAEHPEPPPAEGVDFSPRDRDGLCLRAESLTWQHALFAVEAGHKVAYVLRDCNAREKYRRKQSEQRCSD